ncbi:MAG: ferric reductase-like transmembrane domain-containing protein [Longimicrobiales bacterium]
MMRGTMILAGYAGAILLPVLGFFWIPGESEHGVLFDIGRAAGIAGFAILMMQALLAGRFKAAEKPFGFDMVIRFHQAMGVFGLLLLLSHPLLLALGGGGWDLIFSLQVPAEIWVGKAALGLLVIQVGVSLFRERVGLGFQKWRVTHDVLGILVLGGVFLHSWAAGDDLEHPFYRVLWVLLLSTAVAAFIYHRLLRPALLARRPWKVTKVEKEAPGVWTVGMQPPGNESGFRYAPGQFHFLTFRRGRGLPVEEHHFTISSSPTEDGQVTSTIKESGDFTASIGETRPDDEVAVQGPFGRFSSAFHPGDRKILFIAGGIGITPIRSMLRYMADRQEDRDVVLLFGNLREADIAFRDELESLARGSRPRLTLVHILSDAGEEWSGPRGFVDREVIETHCPDVSERPVYLCGPPPMANMVREALESLGVSSTRLREEKFSF